MPISSAEPIDVAVNDDILRVIFSDGSQAAGPISYSPRLQAATLQQRQNWTWIGRRSGIHWPEIDEDLSVSGIIRDFGITKAKLGAVA